MSKDEATDTERRDFLGKATMAIGAAGVAGACWPFINSMNPTVDVASQAALEVDLADITPGMTKTVQWRGEPIFIMHRTAEQIAAAAASEGGKQPEEDAARTQRPEWLVVVGVCTHLGCVPNRSAEGWLCPCHGSVYDNSGRVLSGPAPSNLSVPPYQFVADDKIVIG